MPSFFLVRDLVINQLFFTTSQLANDKFVVHENLIPSVSFVLDLSYHVHQASISLESDYILASALPVASSRVHTHTIPCTDEYQQLSCSENKLFGQCKQA